MALTSATQGSEENERNNNVVSYVATSADSSSCEDRNLKKQFDSLTICSFDFKNTLPYPSATTRQNTEVPWCGGRPESLDNFQHRGAVEMKGVAYLPKISSTDEKNLTSCTELNSNEIVRRRLTLFQRFRYLEEKFYEALSQNCDLQYRNLECEDACPSYVNIKTGFDLADINSYGLVDSSVIASFDRMDRRKSTDRDDRSPRQDDEETQRKKPKTENKTRQKESSPKSLEKLASSKTQTLSSDSAAHHKAGESSSTGKTEHVSEGADSPVETVSVSTCDISRSVASTPNIAAASSNRTVQEVASSSESGSNIPMSLPRSELRSQKDTDEHEHELVTSSFKVCGLVETRQASTHMSLSVVGPLSLRAHIDTSLTLATSRPIRPDLRAESTSHESFVESLSDSECSLYCSVSSASSSIVTSEDGGRVDPLAQLLTEGDDTHFIPIYNDATYTEAE